MVFRCSLLGYFLIVRGLVVELVFCGGLRPVTVCGFAFLFNYMLADRASGSVAVPPWDLSVNGAVRT